VIRLSGSHFDQVLARDREAGEVPGIDLAAVDGAAQANNPAGLVVVKIDCAFGVTNLHANALRAALDRRNARPGLRR